MGRRLEDLGNHSVAENAGGTDDWYMDQAPSGALEDAGNHPVAENTSGKDDCFMERAASVARDIKLQPLGTRRLQLAGLQQTTQQMERLENKTL